MTVISTAEFTPVIVNNECVTLIGQMDYAHAGKYYQNLPGRRVGFQIVNPEGNDLLTYEPDRFDDYAAEFVCSNGPRILLALGD